jgi:hypothetical protein
MYLHGIRTCIQKIPNITRKLFLGHFNARVGREDMFEPTIRNGSLQEISNDN